MEGQDKEDAEEPDLSIPGNPDGSPPMVRLVGENGFAIYPKMVPDGNGRWVMADPEAVARALGGPPRQSRNEVEPQE